MELLVGFINSDIDLKKLNTAKLNKKERDIAIIVEKINKIRKHDEEYSYSITVTLNSVYYEKFRNDSGLIVLANEKLPERDESIIPY